MADEFQPVAWALEQQVAGFPSITCASHEQRFCESLAAFTSGAIVVPLVRASALSALREERDVAKQLLLTSQQATEACVQSINRVAAERDAALADLKMAMESAMDATVARVLAERDAAREVLRFVERWAVHHAAKPQMTAREVVSAIANHPDIKAITKSYAALAAKEKP